MDQIAQIKQNLDIVTIVGSYVALKKAGKIYKGLCPFHSEKTPSFTVSPELQIFKCFGCQESGDIFSFVQKVEGLDFPAALEQLADKAGVKLEKKSYDPESKLKKELYWVNEMAAKFYNYLLMDHVMGKPGLDYLRTKRGLSDKTIKAFMLGYAPDAYDTLHKYFLKKGVDEQLLFTSGLITKRDDGSVVDKFRGRIVFPFVAVDGKFLGFTGRTVLDREPKYLNTSETPVFHKSFFMYGLNHAKVAIKKDGAVFVEGNMDVISAHEAGLTNVVAASGTALTQGQLKLISRYTNDVTFCFDTDKAGVAAAFRGIELAENMGFDIKVAVIPEGYKDLDELVKKSPAEAKTFFASAVPAYDFLLFTVIKRYNKDSPEGKKKIVDELVPWFAKIQNKVLFDHYSKEIAKELGLNVETVLSALSAQQQGKYVEADLDEISPHIKASHQSVESYIISLLLSGDLDFMRSMTYKVDPQDFADEKLRLLVVSLQKHLSGDSKKFDPKKFAKTLDDQARELSESLYMQETEMDPAKEFDSVLLRLKNQSAKRRMHAISNEIRLAEESNDTAAVKKLTTEFESLKQNLIM